MIFAVPGGKSLLSSEEMAELKRFLRHAGVDPGAPAPTRPAQPEETAPSPWVVVIDHHTAHIYCAGAPEGPRPESLGVYKPYDPHGFLRHLIHRAQTRLQGQRSPEDPAFYEEIARSLVSAPAIVVVGHGSGKSSAAAFLMSHLERHHSTIAARVIRQEQADLSALTEAQIEALAECYRRH